MIEQFNHEYDTFFAEPNCQKRWERLRNIYSKDYGSFRVLFMVETMCLLDKWREPTPEELTALLLHKTTGGQIAIRIGQVTDLFQPVWPLEVAKHEYLVHRATWDSAFRRRYFLTSIRSFSTALVQTWWAFETLMNDFASIIVEQRRDSLDQMTIALLDEKRPGLDKSGALSFDFYNQPILPRLQFIYRLLTGDELKSRGKEWQDLVALKDARDAYVHRIGKKSNRLSAFESDDVVVNGFTSVRSIIGRVFTRTPEFRAKFVYEYLAFWSCGSEAPFIWDGNEGHSFYLGLGTVSKESVAALFAPFPGSFSAETITLPEKPAAITTPVGSAKTSGKHARRKQRR